MTKKIFEEQKIFPNQIVDYLSIVGDNTDNIPGAKGIGQKNASSLQKFHSVEKIFENINLIPSAKL